MAAHPPLDLTVASYCTVRTVVPSTPFKLARIVDVPADALLATPEVLMVATVTSDEFQAT